MCGIAGIVGPDAAAGPDVDLVACMTRLLAHRGPDGEGVVASGDAVLGNRRLAILDPEGGRQPMETPEGDLAVTFNGAILNHVELRAALEARGARFRTRSDTEVLLHLYRAEGPDLVQRLRGMFAFALHDRTRRCVLLARDAAGVKPLHLARRGDSVLFASEPKALLPALGRAEPDRGGILEYLSFGYRHGRGTLFRGIERLLPGRRLLLEPGRAPREETWWSPPEGPREEPPGGWAAALRAALEDSARISLRSDVPVGATLSGGLDSSAVAVLAGRAGAAGAPAFTGVFPGLPGFDESAYAREAAEASGMEIVPVEPRPEDVERDMLRIVRALDEPAGGPGVLPQFVVAREAARRVRVLLGGQGGDELFAGYARQLADLWLGARAAGDGAAAAALAPALDQLRGYEELVARGERGRIPTDPVVRYHRLVDRREGLAEVLAPDLAAALDAWPAREAFAAAFPETADRDPLARTMRYERTELLPALLHVEDRATMAHGLESRVPLLDGPVLALALSAPRGARLAGGRLKALLRDAVADLLPPGVLARRDKMGFPVPLARWARGPLRGWLLDVLLDRRSRERGLLRPEAVAGLVGGERPWGRALWALLNLELWHRVFVDGPPEVPAE